MEFPLTLSRQSLRHWLLRTKGRTALGLRVASALNRLGVRLLIGAREIVSLINEHVTDAKSDSRIRNLGTLHEQIRRILERQKKEYPHYSYFYGHPYQSFATLGIFGERPTEERFDVYRLRELLGPEDSVLDIGCNCGFMAIYASYRTGCRATGIDINPFMIEIGQRSAEYLEIADRVKLVAGRFQEYQPAERFSVVFSFATHWTDDGNYRVELTEHLKRIHALLKPGGLLVFESHCADVGQAAFYEALESMRGWFDWSERILSDNAQREVYLMRVRTVGAARAA